MPHSSEERKFPAAIVCFVTIHVSSVDVIRVAAPFTLRYSGGRNVNLTTHTLAIPGLRIHGFLAFTIGYSSKIALWNSLYSGVLWFFPT